MRQRPPARPPWWQTFFESTGGAALITVAVGGLLAQWINVAIQRGATEREFNSAWLKARGDQALSAHKDYAVEQTKTVEQLYASVGEIMSSSEALVAATYWNRENPRTDATVVKIAIHFNESEEAWAKSERHFTFLLSYYSAGNRDIVTRWRILGRSIDDYVVCVSKWYDSGSKLYTPEAVCGDQKKNIDAALDRLADDLDKSRTYLWTGWNDPATLRQSLGIDSRPPANAK